MGHLDEPHAELTLVWASMEFQERFNFSFSLFLVLRGFMSGFLKNLLIVALVFMRTGTVGSQVSIVNSRVYVRQ